MFYIFCKKLFITSKIWTDYTRPKDSPHSTATCDGKYKLKKIGRDETIETVNNSLRYLQTDYIDLYLIHSPHSFTGDGRDIMEIYTTLLELKRQGKIRSVGVSNFGVGHLRTMIETYRLPPPSVNQLEWNPFSRDVELQHYCRKYDILIEAYSPLLKARDFQFRRFEHTMNVFQHPVLRYFTKKYRESAAQVLLRWSMQMGHVPIFELSKAHRIKAYTDIFDFKLTETEMEIINLLNEGYAVTMGVSWTPLFTEKWNYKITSKL